MPVLRVVVVTGWNASKREESPTVQSRTQQANLTVWERLKQRPDVTRTNTPRPNIQQARRASNERDNAFWTNAPTSHDLYATVPTNAKSMIDNGPDTDRVIVPTVTLTKAELEQKLRGMYQKGVQTGEKRAAPREPYGHTCPRHHVPLWLEVQPTPDGSWLYCPFCRQDARK